MRAVPLRHIFFLVPEGPNLAELDPEPGLVEQAVELLLGDGVLLHDARPHSVEQAQTVVAAPRKGLELLHAVVLSCCCCCWLLLLLSFGVGFCVGFGACEKPALLASILACFGLCHAIFLEAKIRCRFPTACGKLKKNYCVLAQLWMTNGTMVNWSNRLRG